MPLKTRITHIALLYGMLLVAAALLLPAAEAGAGGPEVHTGSGIYKQGENIEVLFSGLPGSKQDWITLANAEQPDNKYVQWRYTAGVRQGSFRFGPLSKGRYEARVYLDWPKGGYNVVARYAFIVEEGGKGALNKPLIAPTLKLDKTSYVTGQEVAVSYSGMPGNAKDMVAVVRLAPKGEAEGKKYGAYTGGHKSGTMEYPSLDPGSYEARAYVGGSIKARVAFTVTEDPDKRECLVSITNLGYQGTVWLDGAQIHMFKSKPGIEGSYSTTQKTGKGAHTLRVDYQLSTAGAGRLYVRVTDSAGSLHLETTLNDSGGSKNFGFVLP